MSDAVILLFDEETDARIRAAWSALADAGVTRSMLGPGFRPHLTPFVAEELDFDLLHAELTKLANDLLPVTIGLPGIGLFTDTGTVYLSVTPKEALFELHQRVWEVCRPVSESPHPWYLPDGWVPHVTLAFGLARKDLASAVDVLAPLDLKLTASATVLALIRGDLDGWSECREFRRCQEDQGE